MNNNKKFASKYLSFCKRLAKFTELKKDLESEIEGIQELTKNPEAVNFSKRGYAKLRKFSEVLNTATEKVEELQDSTEDLATEVEKTDFSKSVRKVRMLKKAFSDLEGDLKKICDDVKDVIEESAENGEVTGHESAVPATEGIEGQPSEASVTTSVSAVPKTEGTQEGNAALAGKTVAAVAKNFSKTDFLKTKLEGICTSFKNFSDNLEGSGDIIEEITDEVTVENAPEKPVEEAPKSEESFESATEIADGIADDIAEDEFDEAKALEEVDSKEFGAKDLVKKLVKTFGRIKKHFDDKIEAIQKDLAGTPVVSESELSAEEAKSLVSEFKCFSDAHQKNFSKRLTKKFTHFGEVCEECAEGKASTEDVVDAAQDVVDVIDNTKDTPAEFCEFSEKVKKFIKMFSEEAKPTPDVTSENAEVATAPSPEVLEKDSELNSTLATINGKIETLDLNTAIANFSKLSSKALSSIKCFSMDDINAKLELIENFAEEVKNLCSTNMSETPAETTEEVCPKCGKHPCECPPPEEKPAETTETPAETPSETTETPAETPAETTTEETPAETTETPTEETTAESFSVEEDEIPVEEVPAEETPAETQEEAPAETTEETTEEQPTEETPADSEVVLKNFSANANDNKSYGEMMSNLAFMV